jgi:hypothetical protein
MNAVIADLCFNTGYSLLQWQHGLTVMLEKKPGVIKVKKLQAILMMEVDYHGMNKVIFGQRMSDIITLRMSVPAEEEIMKQSMWPFIGS